MTNVLCDWTYCKFNVDCKCSKDEIVIGSFGGPECNDFEEKEKSQTTETANDGPDDENWEDGR